MEFASPSAGGGFFKPAEHVNDVALLIEVKRVDLQRPTTYGPKDSVVTKTSIFATQADLDAGKPSEIKDDYRYEQTALAGTLKDMVGKATIVKLEKGTSSKPGQQPPWVFRAVDPAVQQKVVEYATKHEEELAAAKAAAPSFND